MVDSGLRCVLPMGPRKPLWPWQGRTHVMGVLNVTPDSFSDGGLSLKGPQAALQRSAVHPCLSWAMYGSKRNVQAMQRHLRLAH